MNKRCYRVIFNQSRGVLMAVAETAKKRVKASQGESATTRTTRPRLLLKPVLAGILLSATPVASAQIIPDSQAPANQRPTVLSDQSGRPLVHIQTPSAAGVSRNTYSQFDIDSKGAVLNNSRYSNPWLKQGSAKVILNEVNSTRPSQLKGAIEVSGASAQVVVTNPAGIQVDGGKFVNASRVTLTTGHAKMQDGDLTGFDIQGGTVDIRGAGLDTTNATYTEILSQFVKVSGDVHANQLNVTAGKQTVDYKTGQTSNHQSGGRIDTYHLGGMYANSITLVANGQGAGVNNRGTISADNNLVVTAEGRLLNTGTMQAQNMVLATSAEGNVDNRGSIQAQDSLHISAAQDVVLRGSGAVQEHGSQVVVSAGRHIRLTTDARIESQQAGGQLQLSAGDSIIAGKNTTIMSQQDALLDAGQRIVATAAQLSSDGHLQVQAQERVQLRDSSVDADTVQMLTAKPSDERDHAIQLNTTKVEAENGITLSAAGSVLLSNAEQTALWSQSGDINLQAGRSVALRQNTVLDAISGVVNLSAGQNINLATNSKINASKDVQLTAARRISATATSVAGSGNVTVFSGEKIWARNTLFQGYQVFLGTDVPFDPQDNHIIYLQDVAINSRENTQIQSSGSLVWRGDSIDLKPGSVLSSIKGLSLTTKEELLANQSTVLSEAGIAIRAETFNADQASFVADNTLDIRATQQINSHQSEFVGDNTRLYTKQASTEQDHLISLDQGYVHGDSTVTIRSMGNLLLDSPQTTQIFSSGNVNLIAAKSVTLKPGTTVVSEQGYTNLRATENINLEDGALVHGAAGVNLNAGQQLVSQGGWAQSSGRVRAYSKQQIWAADATFSGSKVWLETQKSDDPLANRDIQLERVAISGAQSNILRSGGNLSWQGGDIQLANAKLSAVGDVAFNATGNIQLQQTQLNSQKNLNINASNLISSASRLVASDALHVQVAENILAAESSFSAKTAFLGNTPATTEQPQSIQLNNSVVSGQQGVNIQATGTVILDRAGKNALTSSEGMVNVNATQDILLAQETRLRSALQTIELHAGNDVVLLNDSRVNSRQDLVVSAGQSLILDGGRLFAAGNLNAQAGSALWAQGASLVANDQIQLHTTLPALTEDSGINLDQSYAFGRRGLSMQSASDIVLNKSGGLSAYSMGSVTLSAAGHLAVAADTKVSAGAGSLTLDAGQNIDLNNGSQLRSGRDVQLHAHNIVLGPQSRINANNGTLVLQAAEDMWLNDSSRLNSRQSVELLAGRDLLIDGGLIRATDSIRALADRQIWSNKADLRAGELLLLHTTQPASSGEYSIQLNESDLVGQKQMQIQSPGNIVVNTAGKSGLFSRANIMLDAGKNIQVKSGSRIYGAFGTVALNSAQNLVLESNAKLLSGQDMSLTAGELMQLQTDSLVRSSQSGVVLSSGQNLDLKGNVRGKLGIDVAAGQHWLSETANLYTNGVLTAVAGQDIWAKDSVFNSQQMAMVTMDDDDTTTGQSIWLDNVALNSANGLQLHSAGDLIWLGEEIKLTAGTQLSAAQNLSLQASANLKLNQVELNSQQNISLQGFNVRLVNSQINAAQALDIQAQNSISDVRSHLSAQHTSLRTAPDATQSNQWFRFIGSNIQGHNSLSISNPGSVVMSQTQLSSAAGEVAVNAGTNLVMYNHSQITTPQNTVYLAAGNDIRLNDTTAINSQQDIQFLAKSLRFIGATVDAANHLIATAEQRIYSNNSTLNAGNQLQLHTTQASDTADHYIQLHNSHVYGAQQVTMQAAGNLSINSKATQGIRSEQDINLASDRSITIKAGSPLSANQGALSLQAKNISVQGHSEHAPASLYAQQGIVATAQQLTFKGSKLQSGGDIVLNASNGALNLKATKHTDGRYTVQEIEAAGDLIMSSMQRLYSHGAQLNANNIVLDSEGTIYLNPVLERITTTAALGPYQSQETVEQRVKSTQLNATQNISINGKQAQRSVNLVAANLTAGQGIDIQGPGKIFMGYANTLTEHNWYAIDSLYIQDSVTTPQATHLQADSINLMGGVIDVYAPTLSANSGGLFLTAIDSDLRLRKLDSQSANLTSQGMISLFSVSNMLFNGSQIASNADIYATAMMGALTINQGTTINAEQEVQLSGDRVNLSYSQFRSGTALAIQSAQSMTLNNADITAGTNLALQPAQNLTIVDSDLRSGLQTQLNAAGKLSIRDSRVRSDDQVVVTAATTLNASNSELSGQQVELNTRTAADGSDNTHNILLHNSVVYGKQQVSIAAAGSLTINNPRHFAIWSDDINLHAGGNLKVYQNTHLQSRKLGNISLNAGRDIHLFQDSQVTADSHVQLVAGGRLYAYAGSTLTSGGQLHAQATQRISLNDSNLLAGQDLSLQSNGHLGLNQATLQSNNGSILVQGIDSLVASRTDFNAMGNLILETGSDTNSSSLVIDHGTLFAAQNIGLNASTNITLFSRGQLMHSGNDINLQAGNNLTLTPGIMLEANQGQLTLNAGGVMQLQSAPQQNRVWLQAQQGIDMTAARISMHGSTLNSAGSVSLLASEGALSLKGQPHNDFTQPLLINAGTDLSLSSTDDLIVDGALLNAGANMLLQSDQGRIKLDASDNVNELTAGSELNVIALDQGMTIKGSQLAASNLNLIANGDISIMPDVNVNTETIIKDNGGEIRAHTDQNSYASFNASEHLSIVSIAPEADIFINGATLNAEQTLNIGSNGNTSLNYFLEQQTQEGYLYGVLLYRDSQITLIPTTINAGSIAISGNSLYGSATNMTANHGGLYLTAAGANMMLTDYDGAQSTLAATTDIGLFANGQLLLDETLVQADGNLYGTVLAGHFTSNDSNLSAGQAIDLAADNGVFLTDTHIAGQDIALSSGDNRFVAKDANINASQTIQLSSNQFLKLTDSTVNSEQDDLTLLAKDGILSHDSTLRAGRNLHLETGAPFMATDSLIEVVGGSLNAGQHATVVASGDLDLSGTDNGLWLIKSGQDLTLEAGGNLTFSPGTVVSADNGTLTMKAAQQLVLNGSDSNENRSLLGYQGINLTAGSITMNGSRLNSFGDVNITATEGDIDLSLKTNANTTYVSSIRAGGDLLISAYGGNLLAKGVNLEGQQVSLLSNGDTTVERMTVDIETATGTGELAFDSDITAQQDLIVGTIHQDKTVVLSGAKLNAGGNLRVKGNSNILIGYANKPAKLNAEQDILIEGGAISAWQPQLDAKGNIQLISREGSLAMVTTDQQNSTLNAQGNISLYAHNVLKLEQANLSSQQSLYLVSNEGEMTIEHSELIAADKLSLANQFNQTLSDTDFTGGSLSVLSKHGDLTLSNSQFRTTKGGLRNPVHANTLSGLDKTHTLFKSEQYALEYIASYGDLIQAFGGLGQSIDAQTGVTHYQNHGHAEGRRIKFDPWLYLASNPDLVEQGLSVNDATEHYLTSGYWSGRSYTSFDAMGYLASNPDLLAAYGADPSRAALDYVLFSEFYDRQIDPNVFEDTPKDAYVLSLEAGGSLTIDHNSHFTAKQDFALIQGQGNLTVDPRRFSALGHITLAALDGTLTIDKHAQQTFSMQSNGDLNLQGDNLTLTGDRLNANGTIRLSSPKAYVSAALYSIKVESGPDDRWIAG